MKLRRIGNSLGTTFSREILQKASLAGDEELELITFPGEIRLRRVSDRIVVQLTEAEAKALTAGNLETKAATTALAKVRALLGEEKEE